MDGESARQETQLRVGVTRCPPLPFGLPCARFGVRRRPNFGSGTLSRTNTPSCARSSSACSTARGAAAFSTRRRVRCSLTRVCDALRQPRLSLSRVCGARWKLVRTVARNAEWLPIASRRIVLIAVVIVGARSRTNSPLGALRLDLFSYLAQGGAMRRVARYRGRAVRREREALLPEALAALSFGELRTFVADAIDRLDDGPRGELEDLLLRRAAQSASGWRPPAPQGTVVAEVRAFLAASRHDPSVDPAERSIATCDSPSRRPSPATSPWRMPSSSSS